MVSIGGQNHHVSHPKYPKIQSSPDNIYIESGKEKIHSDTSQINNHK